MADYQCNAYNLDIERRSLKATRTKLTVRGQGLGGTG
jgi:hypothetical protein